MPVIGFLHVASQEAYSHVVAGFRRGLAETDFVEGRNVAVEYRWGEGQLDRMPSLLADLLDHHASVIVASLQGAQAAKSAGVTIPVVFSTADLTGLKRVTEAIGRVMAGPPGRRVAVFTSGGPIGFTVHRSTNAPERTFLDVNWRVRNLSVSEFLFDRDRLTLDTFNSIAHLEERELWSYR